MAQPVRLKPATQRSFLMEKTNATYGAEGADTTITIRQATQRDKERIDDLNAEFSRIYGVDETGKDQVMVRQKFNFAKLQRHQANCTMVSCTLEHEDGSLVFSPDVLADPKKFERAWGELPTDVVEEIMDFIYDLNPSWDPNRGEAD